MPRKQLQTIAKKAGLSPSTVERYWDEAEQSAREQDPDDFYAYVMGTVKRRIANKKSQQEACNVRDELREVAPELVSYVPEAEYKIVRGIHEETAGMSPDGRWFGAVIPPEHPDEPILIILFDKDADMAALSALDVIDAEEASPNPLPMLLSENAQESSLHCPKCNSDDVLAGTKELKNRCGECEYEWGEGDKPKKEKDSDVANEMAVTTGVVAAGPSVALPPPPKKRRRKKRNVEESYNDNYNRPNQQEKRTALRQADGTTPPGSIDDPDPEIEEIAGDMPDESPVGAIATARKMSDIGGWETIELRRVSEPGSDWYAWYEDGGQMDLGGYTPSEAVQAAYEEFGETGFELIEY